MYAELHAHSAFSFLDGASLPDELATTAAELGYSAFALTDHNGLSGSMELAQAAGVSTVPGIGYGKSCDRFIRLSVGSEDMERIAQGVTRISQFITDTAAVAVYR